MKKVFTVLLLSLTCWLNASAINEMVAKMGTQFKNGDLYSITYNVPAIREMAAKEGGENVFSDVDLAFCNYFEALASHFLMDNVEDKDAKLAQTRSVFGDDHYVTLSTKAIYERITPQALKTLDEALAAVEDELGRESWQYVALLNRKAEAMGNNNKIQEASDAIEVYCKSLQGTDLENNWMTATLHGLRCALLSALQRWNDMGPDFEVSAKVFSEMMEGINNGTVEPLAMSGAAHLGFYVMSTGRSLGEHDTTIKASEDILEHLTQMEMDQTGLAYSYKSNIAIAYYKEKKYAKSRPMMEDYLKYLENNGMKGSQPYEYIAKLLKQTPKRK